MNSSDSRQTTRVCNIGRSSADTHRHQHNVNSVDQCNFIINVLLNASVRVANSRYALCDHILSTLWAAAVSCGSLCTVCSVVYDRIATDWLAPFNIRVRIIEQLQTFCLNITTETDVITVNYLSLRSIQCGKWNEMKVQWFKVRSKTDSEPA